MCVTNAAPASACLISKEADQNLAKYWTNLSISGVVRNSQEGLVDEYKAIACPCIRWFIWPLHASTVSLFFII